MITIKILLRKDVVKKDGKMPIYMRITFDRKQKFYSLNVACYQNEWDARFDRVKNSLPIAKEVNNQIEIFYKKAKDIIYSYQVENKKLTFADFEALFLQKEKICKISQLNITSTK